MRVLLAGAGGAIGRQLLPMLLAVGHEVHATTRRDAAAKELEQSGATVHIVDLLKSGAAAELIERVQPEIVIDQLTSLPQDFDPRAAADAYATNDRVRREASRSLIEAARGAGVGRYVLQSVAFLYLPGDDRLRVESDPLWLDAPEPLKETARVLDDNERAVLRGGDLDGVVLRYGFLYGPGTWWQSDGSNCAAIRRGRYPVVGAGVGVCSLVHVHDAALAALRAVEHGNGIYNVVDDEPVSFGELLPRVAEMIDARAPRRVPTWLSRLLVGPGMTAAATELAGASNARAKQELGWSPRLPTWRTGLRDYRDSSPTS